MKSGKASSRKGWTDRFKSKKSAKWFDKRLVSVGGREYHGQTEDGQTQVKFCDNHIKSSKYNIFTFWIINPLEQFRRIANAYFLLGNQLSLISVFNLSLHSSRHHPARSPGAAGVALHLGGAAGVRGGDHDGQAGLRGLQAAQGGPGHQRQEGAGPEGGED